MYHHRDLGIRAESDNNMRHTNGKYSVARIPAIRATESMYPVQSQYKNVVVTLLGFGPKIEGSVVARPDGLLLHENRCFRYTSGCASIGAMSDLVRLTSPDALDDTATGAGSEAKILSLRGSQYLTDALVACELAEWISSNVRIHHHQIIISVATP